MRFYTADTETSDGLKGCKFAVGSLCFSEEKTPYSEYDMDKFTELLLRYKSDNKRKNIIYFHNVSFDIRFILQYCWNNKIPFEAPIKRGSMILEQRIGEKENPLIIRDSYALISLPLRKFSKVFSLEENKIKVDFTKKNAPELLKERCDMDTIILYKSLLKFFKLFPLAESCVSLPQTSMKDFHRNFNNNWSFTTSREKNQITVNTGLEDKARDGYHGGRNEIYNLNYFDKVYYHDVNSLYPFVMANNDYPIDFRRNDTKEVLKEDLYLVKAKISLLYQYIPALPHKEKKLLFCYGSFEDWFFSPEFKLIEGLVDSIEIKEGYSFTPFPLFKEFVNKYYNMRLDFIKDNNPLEKAVKLYMNSLYGKFGQKRESEGLKYTDTLTKDCEEISDGVYAEKVKGYSKSQKINPFISGFVTSYARAYLYNNMNEDSIYCDTDSIISTKKLHNIGTGLGQFKIEGIGEFKAFCPKTYFFLNNLEIKHKFDIERDKYRKYYRNKAKGIFYDETGEVKDYIKADYPDEFINSIKKTDYSIYAKPTECIRRFGNFLSVKDVTKKLTLNYDKRIVLEDMTTKPIQLI